MGFDQLPVNGFAEQGIDVLIPLAFVRLVEHQLLQIPDAGHQVDTQQVSQPEDGRTLRLSIAMQGVRLDIGIVFDQPVKDVNGLINAARDEVAEQRDVFVGDVLVAHPAVATVPYVVFR